VRAVAIDEFGGREKMQLRDLPEPKMAPDCVTVRLRAAGVNPVDWKTRIGRQEPRFACHFPLVLGWDMAGVVERAGPSSRGVAVGDEVMAYARKQWLEEGTYAEVAVVPDSYLVPRPAPMDFVAAAALPLAGLTAYQVLVDWLEIGPGQTVVVPAAAGGVGHLAVQIARDRGAQVIGTAGPDNQEFIRGLGVDMALDYHDDWVGQIREAHPDGVDAFFDTVGEETQEQGAGLLREGGRIASIIDPGVKERPGGLYVFVRPSGSQLAELGRMVEAGRLTVHVQETFPLERAADSHAVLEEGHVRGKLVLEIG
jgi:NADPH:quinone reductase-like Zn-dependent oxidoreductase